MTGRCLVIDDSHAVRHVAGRVLARRGMLVNEAATAVDALALCRLDMPDMIIVACSLPDMDTVEFIRTVSSIPVAARPLICVLMVRFDLPTLLRCRRAGARAHLMKPFTIAQMDARLDEIEAERVARAA